MQNNAKTTNGVNEIEKEKKKIEKQQQLSGQSFTFPNLKCCRCFPITFNRDFFLFFGHCVCVFFFCFFAFSFSPHLLLCTVCMCMSIQSQFCVHVIRCVTFSSLCVFWLCCRYVWEKNRLKVNFEIFAIQIDIQRQHTFWICRLIWKFYLDGMTSSLLLLLLFSFVCVLFLFFFLFFKLSFHVS